MLKRERDPQVAVLGVLAAALVVAAVGAVALPGSGFPGSGSLVWTVAAGFFEGAYFLALAAALSRATYGAVYAIARGGALVLVWPAAALLLGERATPSGALGALIVALGVTLVALAGRERASGGGVAWAVGCAASIAGYHLCYDRALAGGAAPAPVFAVALAVALPMVWGSVWIAARALGEPGPRERIGLRLRGRHRDDPSVLLGRPNNTAGCLGRPPARAWRAG